MGALDDLTGRGHDGLDRLLRDPTHALVALDYDGTLSPIVDDPTRALPFPGAVELLAELSAAFGSVAIVTGRPAAQAARLLRLEGRTDVSNVTVLGQYGVERRDGATGSITALPAPPAIDDARAELPELLAAVGVRDAVVEDKGRALAVHVRRSADPAEALRKVSGPLADLAARYGLRAEPGRLVVELRGPGVDKGTAIRGLLEASPITSVLAVGDDLGDLAAFDEVEDFRSPARAGAGLLVCSGSTEVRELADRADLVVDGPPGVERLLRELLVRLHSR